MITIDNVLLASGVIVIVLVSATIINYTTKPISVHDKPKKPILQTYDPDVTSNCTRICIFSQNPYSTKYNSSSCFNKTLLQWYNPWVSHTLWEGFWAKRKTKNQLSRKPTNTTEALNVDSPDPPEVKRKLEKVFKETPVEFAYSLLVGLLVVSGIFACWEVCKDTMKRKEAAAAKAQERQCTLADFTIKRHLRRESQQQTGSHLPRQPSLELTAKVTQTLTHQSSLDRAFPNDTSEALSSSEFRRNSVPVNLSDIQPTGSRPGKRQSMDVTAEEINFDCRRKPRHFIRRH